MKIIATVTGPRFTRGRTYDLRYGMAEDDNGDWAHIPAHTIQPIGQTDPAKNGDHGPFCEVEV